MHRHPPPRFTWKSKHVLSASASIFRLRVSPRYPFCSYFIPRHRRNGRKEKSKRGTLHRFTRVLSPQPLLPSFLRIAREFVSPLRKVENLPSLRANRIFAIRIKKQKFGRGDNNWFFDKYAKKEKDFVFFLEKFVILTIVYYPRFDVLTVPIIQL